MTARRRKAPRRRTATRAAAKGTTRANAAAGRKAPASKGRALRTAIAAAVREIRATRRALVTCHVSPDGDAIGSSLALALALRGRGAEVTVWSADPVPYNYAFLPGAGTVVRALPAGAAFDHTYILDLSEESRLGPGFPKAGLGTVVNIDHHATGGGLGTVHVRDPAAAATGELIHRILTALKAPITAAIATNIYCAVLTDTGSFHYGNSSPTAFAIAGAMVARGASPWRIASAVYEDEPLVRYTLLGRALATLELACGGKIATLYVTNEMYRATGSSKEMTDQFVNYARSIRGVEVAIFFRELPDGRFKASMRSRGAIDVSAVGARFSGGGHKNAAGAELPGPIDRARATLAAAFAGVLGCAP